MILASKHLIKQNLTAYGEFELAEKVDKLKDEDLDHIGQLAAKHIRTVGLIDKQITLGAIEFLEGQARKPKRKKRDMSVYDEPDTKPKENVFTRFFRSRKNP